MDNSSKIKRDKPEIKLVLFRLSALLLWTSTRGTYSTETVEPPGLTVFPCPDIVSLRRLVWARIEIIGVLGGEGASDAHSVSSQK